MLTKQRKCQNCTKYRQYYYKGRRQLIPSEFGRCIKDFNNPVEVKEVCKRYEERDNTTLSLERKRKALETLLGLMGEIQDLLLILLSEKEEKNGN